MKYLSMFIAVFTLTSVGPAEGSRVEIEKETERAAPVLLQTSGGGSTLDVTTKEVVWL